MYRNFTQELEKIASSLSLGWDMSTAVVVERTPVVLPEPEQWEKDYVELSSRLEYYDIHDWPKGLGPPHPSELDKMPGALALRLVRRIVSHLGFQNRSFHSSPRHGSLLPMPLTIKHRLSALSLRSFPPWGVLCMLNPFPHRVCSWLLEMRMGDGASLRCARFHPEPSSFT